MSAAKIRKQATQWLVRIQTTRDLERLWPQFEAWLKENPRHLKAYQLEERKWARCDSLRSLALRDPSLTPEAMTEAVDKARGRRQVVVRARVGVAAVLCIALVLGIWIWSGRARVEAHPWVPYVAEADGVTPVILEEGSVLQLKADSQVHVRLTDSAREVDMDWGEAYFDVSPDRARPFRVAAGPLTVQAMGTTFSVRKDDNGQVEAAVKRGKVAVAPARRMRATADDAKILSPEIGPGQVATINPAGQVIVEKISQAEMDKKLAWANQSIDLDGTLGEAVAQFNRYNSQKLVIREPELASVRISGTYRLTEPDAFAQSLIRLGIRYVTIGAQSSSEAKILLSKNGD